MRNKKHFQRLLGLAFFCFCSLLASAENYSFTLVVNGVSYVFNLAEKPVITYEGDQLTVKVTEPSAVVEEQSTVSEISVPVTEVQNIDLEKVNVKPKETDGVETVKTASEFVNGQLELSGLQPGSQVTVVSMGGRTVLTANASDDGKAAVSLQSLPGGVYIVRTPQSSIKVTNK